LGERLSQLSRVWVKASEDFVGEPADFEEIRY
jgi:hypothetical protein